MVEFRYIPTDEMAERHRPRNPVTPSRQAPERRAEHKNVEIVLNLGDIRYVSFHQRVYQIPAVPFKLGHRVLQSQVKVQTFAKQVELTGNQVAMDNFFVEMGVLSRLLWKHLRPTGKVRRMFWRCGLLRNPFRHASEAELGALTDFFLQGRMMSSVQSTLETRKI